jgi:hypothetical protein
MDKERLISLEAIIEANQKSFYAAGQALFEIQAHRLYRQIGFGRFEDYVKSRWDMSISHCYRLIDAFKVVANLSPIGEILPTNEARARCLTKLDPSRQQEVWWAFLASGTKQSARNIAKFVASYTDKKDFCPPQDRIDVISEEYQKAVTQMLYQIRLAQNDAWQSTSRQAALYWNQVMKEKILWKL